MRVACGRLEKRGRERMRNGAVEAHLEDVQRRDEEGVTVELDDSRSAVLVPSAHSQPRGLESRLELGVEPVAAEVRLDGFPDAVDRGDARAQGEPNPVTLARERALERGHGEALGAGIRLGVVCILDPEHVPRELEHDVLEAAAGADERQPALAREADRGQRAVHARVRAPGRDQETVAVGERERGIADGRRRNPGVLDIGRRQLGVDRPVRLLELGVVADDRDPGRAGHHPER